LSETLWDRQKRAATLYAIILVFIAAAFPTRFLLDLPSWVGFLALAAPIIVSLHLVNRRYGKIVLLALAGGEPAIPPLPAIPARDYYFLQVFFMPLVMISAWILASGVVQLLGKPFGGNGTFEDTLSLLGFGIAVPTYVTLILDASLDRRGRADATISRRSEGRNSDADGRIL